MFKPHRRSVASVLSLSWLVGCQQAEQKAPPPPPVVKVAEVASRDVPIYMEAIGQTIGNQEIEISARVEGFLETVNFAEGTFVKKGQVLYTIDSRPFRAALAQAKANVSKAQAEVARAHQDVERYAPLVAKNAVSVQEYETAQSQERADQSALEGARAAEESARINLGYTTVLAPDDGLIGITQAHPGTLVGRGLSTLTQISKVDPIDVRFSIPERQYLYFARRREAKLAGKDAGAPDAGKTPASETTFQLFLADGSEHPYPGKLVFVDRNVDSKTGTILLEAAFPNADTTIRPGQFARVRALVDTKKGAVVVPQAAVQDQQGVSSVAVVKADDTVEIRLIKPGDRVGTLLVVESGVQPHERIVVEGLQKVRPGLKVNPQTVPLEDPGASEPSPATSAASPAGSAPSPVASGP
jgi:membrane fusion protein, multidrug efflux system